MVAVSETREREYWNKMGPYVVILDQKS